MMISARWDQGPDAPGSDQLASEPRAGGTIWHSARLGHWQLRLAVAAWRRH